MLTNLTQASQVTISTDLRRKAGLRPKDKVEIDWDEKQAALILRKLEVPSLQEIFEEVNKLPIRKDIHLTPEELDEEIERELFGRD